jgi:GNAT superfamily N-acetyltransferase
MIRAAGRGDVKEIAAMIRELAVYEKLEHEVVLDESRLAEHLFGARPYVEALIAEEGSGVETGSGAVGFAIFFHNYSTFVGRPGIYLEDIFVRPEFRGRGHGKALLARIARLAVERECGRVEWSVLDWNEAAIAFYRSLGAVANDEWTVHRLNGEALRRLAEEGR